MNTLKLLQTRDGREIRIVTEIAGHNWQDMAFALEFSPAEVGVVSKNHPSDVEAACTDLLSRWLTGGHRKPVSWQTMVQCLREINLNSLAFRLEASLQDP